MIKVRGANGRIITVWLKGAPVAEFLSDEWLTECKRTLQGSEEFKSEARGFSGDFILSFEADEGLDRTKRLFLSIRGGDCVEAVFLNSEPLPPADYRISAPYSLWTRMIKGEEDAFAAFATRRVKVKGSLLRLMANSSSAVALVKALAAVPMDFR